MDSLNLAASPKSHHSMVDDLGSSAYNMQAGQQVGLSFQWLLPWEWGVLVLKVQELPETYELFCETFKFS